MSRDSEEFDRIVEGLEFNFDDLDDFDAEAEAAATELAEEPVVAEEPPPEFAELVYREPPPAPTNVNPWRKRAWLFLIATPTAMILSSLLDLWVPTFVWTAAVVLSVATVAYLVLTLPDDGPSTPGFGDDGAAL